MIVGSIKENITLEKRISLTPESANNIIFNFNNNLEYICGGRDKNRTYDLFDVNEAFYHWTTRPKPKNKHGFLIRLNSNSVKSKKN